MGVGIWWDKSYEHAPKTIAKTVTKTVAKTVTKNAGKNCKGRAKNAGKKCTKKLFKNIVKLDTKPLHFFPAFFAHPLQIFPAFFAAPYHTPDNPQIHNPVNILCGAYPPPALDIISYIWGHGAWYVVLPPPYVP